MKNIFIYILLWFHVFFTGSIWVIINNNIAHAAVWDIGHWRDGVWGQIPGTGFTGFNFDGQIRNDWIYSKPSNDTIQLNEAGDYLIIATTTDEDTSNGRYNSQLRVSQTAGTGELFTSHYSGYSRDNSENESWTRAISVIIWASANSQIQVQKRRDTDAPTWWSIINASDVQVIRLAQTNYWIYTIWWTGNVYGGTVPNTVSIDSIVSQSDAWAIEWNIVTDTVTVKWDNKKYLIAWSTSFNWVGNRTQRVWHLDYDGNDILSTRAYCYRRNTPNEYCGLGSMDLIETWSADIEISAEVFRGLWTWADQWWADTDQTMTTDGNGQMIILEMPDTLEAFRSEDSNWLQDVTTAQSINFARNVNINTGWSFTKNSDTQISVTNPADIFSWTNIWTARSNIAAWQRQTSFGSIVINWVEQSVWKHWSYSRWNQWTTDTFAMGFQPAGIYTTTWAWTTLWVNTDPLAWWEAGWNDRTQPWTVWFFALNLDTLVPREPILSITKTDNDPDNTVQTDQIIKYTITLSNAGSNATGISITDTIDTDFGSPYNFTYSSCWSPSESFIDPTLTFSSVSVNEGIDCVITYDLQVDSSATTWATITNSANASAATEWWNDPAIVSADTLTILACSTNDAILSFTTDNWWEDTYWSLTPTGNACGVWEIANGWNTTDLTCASWWAQSANAANGYADNFTIVEWPYNLTVWTQYDLHVIDDWGDGMTSSPDVTVTQNWLVTDTFVVENTWWVFTFTVEAPLWCSDTVWPDVEINQATAQVDPTTVDSATYTVTFDEVINTSTFTSWDITLSGTTGTVTSGPTEIAPNNGTNFEFTVTGMTDGDTVVATIAGWVIEDIAGNLNNPSTSTDNSITFDWWDTTPPIISSTNFASGSLLPGWNHAIEINYSDTNSWIDIATVNIELLKWDGVSTYGPDISGSNISTNNITATNASYDTNNLDFGKYRYTFSISDNDGNTATETVDFYIDIPEFTVSTWSIDIWTLNHITNTFSDIVTVTVATVGAGFDVYINSPSPLIDRSEQIELWNGTTGFGYDPAPYSSNISTIGTDQNIGTQAANINTNWDKNTYTFDIKLWALINEFQASWDYEWNIDIWVIFDY